MNASKKIVAKLLAGMGTVLLCGGLTVANRSEEHLEGLMI